MTGDGREGTDVAIIGAGIAGSAVAWRCARRGLRVRLFEQFELGHVRGSSHGRARIFRLAYEQPDYVSLVQRALPLWREAERNLDVDLLQQTGALDLGPPHLLEPLARALAHCDAPYQRWDRKTLEAQFPFFRLDDGWEALYQPEGGTTNADEARLGFVTLARRLGADVVEGTPVLAIEPDSDGVTLRTAAGEYRAHQVVVAAAGWSNQLLEPLGLAIPISITREQVLYVPPPPGRVIPFIWHPETPGQSYGLPAGTEEFYGLPNGSQLKVGEHKAGPVINLGEEGGIDAPRLERVREWMRRHLPTIASEPSTAETCLYATTPDDDFVIDRAGPIVLALGFGGHGFKFGPLLGELVADVLEDREIPAATRFTRSRFEASTRGTPAGTARP